MAHHVGMDFAPFRFFFAEKSVITLRHSSFIVKRHVRFACSFASALTTALGHYHLFARVRLTAQGFLLKQVSLVPIFYFIKKSVITLRHSSFIAKRHVRFACSFTSALTTALSRYHLFARVRLTAQGFSAVRVMDFAPIQFCPKINRQVN